MKNTKKKDHYIVAAGASAGGLDALITLVSTLHDEPVSFIVLLHLPANYKSQTKEILSNHTAMPILEVKDNMPVKPGTIYLMPGSWTMTLEQGHFKLKKKQKSFQTPIDLFLESLAIEHGPKSIAIILSGSGFDGSKGIKAIKKAGGFVIAQDPDTCRFDTMPRKAMETGFVDMVLVPEEMPQEISNYIANPGLVYLYKKELTAQDEESVVSILHSIRDCTGRDFTAYKRPTIIRRLQRRMLQLHLDSMQDYVGYLTIHPEEIPVLYNEFLIGVTSFFRDPEAFEIIQNTVIPDLLKNRHVTDQLRIWVAGCCTGEEAYTWAILIREYVIASKKNYNVRILASDIDKKALEIASKGSYPIRALEDLSAERLNTFFIKSEKEYTIVPEIRKMVIFAEHDIIYDPPFSKMDVLSCRNLLIYMNPDLQKKILTTFHGALKLGGYLFLGPNENKDPLKSFFQDIHPKWKIYKNSELAKGIWHTKQSIAKLNPSRNYSAFSSGNVLSSILTEHISDIMLEEQNMAGICINENYEIIKAFGDFKKYLHLPDKIWGFNLLKMVPEELSIAISSGIHTVSKTHQKLTIQGVHNQDNFIQLVIKPFSTTDQKNTRLFLVLLQDQNEIQDTAQNLQVFNKEIYFNDRLAELEAELKNTKDNLYATVEELEASNEELQSANEELLSANEELQSTNEELQSLNEELNTVNREYEGKIQQLTELHDDLDNYFRASHVSQVFIDRQLIVRKFTPASKKLINLIDSDIGRPIADISINILYGDLIEDLNTVIKESVPVEKTLKTKESKSYQMKIIPYLRRDKIIDGAIITFADITNDLKKAEKNTLEKLIQQKEILNAVIDTQEAERKRIGESLHNGLGQILYTVKLKLEGVKPDTDPNRLKKIGEEAQALLLEAIKETRHLSSELMPVILEDYGLASAIDAICKRLKENLKVNCKIQGFEKRLESQFEIAIYRIIQELSNNIIKHARASMASIVVNHQAGHVSIHVKDNGRGFNKDDYGMGIGLSSIKSRVKLLGGQLKIISKINAGTDVSISFQL